MRSAVSGLPRRPVPPEELAEASDFGAFRPAADLAAWARAAFISPDGPLHDEYHAELEEARIGFVWTNERRDRGDGLVLGEAGLARAPRAVSGWTAAAYRYQLREFYRGWWEGDEPADREAHFSITIYAPWFAEATDVDALTLLKHELCHCAQARVGGELRYDPRSGDPVWTLRPHDLEIFEQEVKWFGPDAMGGRVRRLLDLAKKPPLAGRAAIAGVCGSCRKAA